MSSHLCCCVLCLWRVADSGAGSHLVKPSVVPGTVNVLIGGEAAPEQQISQPSIARPDGDWTLMHPLWKDNYVHQVTYTHLPPVAFVDKLALWTIRLIRFNFDWMSGYSFGKLTEKKALTRIVFLETVAGVPGSVGSTLRRQFETMHTRKLCRRCLALLLYLLLAALSWFARIFAPQILHPFAE